MLSLVSPSLQTRSPFFCYLNRIPRSQSRIFRILRACSNSSNQSAIRRNNYAGVQLDETVEAINSPGKLRIDSWISSRIDGISRARVQSSIKSGLVAVNGRVVSKASHTLREGDIVNCTISEVQPLRADPEDIPLDIVFEDEHVLVVNKPAHMVVHPAPGNASGTLVNGILHHCSLPTISFTTTDELLEAEDIPDEDFNCFDGQSFIDPTSSIRPGIVHRLDKGTSGLLVVAKNEHAHAHLSEQFKQHTIHRVYVSVTCGLPNPITGRVEISIGRDPSNRIRMTAVSGIKSVGHARHAASRYKVIEILAGGGAALVEWRLETGRTHQIRAHAKYMGIPLLGDDIYGGSKGMALSLLRPRTPPSHHPQLSKVISRLERPCLHALALGFRHPGTEENIQFTCQPPEDFIEILSILRKIGMQKVTPAQTENIIASTPKGQSTKAQEAPSPTGCTKLVPVKLRKSLSYKSFLQIVNRSIDER